MFTFKQFHIDDTHCSMKVGTDGVLLGAWAALHESTNLLDIGTGSGLIALMLAQRNAQAHVTGIELDEAAAADARQNVAASPFASRINIVCGNVLTYPDAAGGAVFDHIVSNPPYHEEELLPPSARRAAARHTSGGGLTFAALLRTAAHVIVPGPQSRFSVILPSPALPTFLPLAAVHGFYLARQTNVVTRPGKPCKRVLLEFRLQPTPTAQTDELVLVADDGGRSAAYSALCADFYL